MKKFKANRKSFKFDYEFADGTIVKVDYLEPTTTQIDESLTVGEDVSERLTYTKDVLRECLRADEEVIDKIILEQTNEANIYEFKGLLDEELGKLKRKD